MITNIKKLFSSGNALYIVDPRKLKRPGFDTRPEWRMPNDSVADLLRLRLCIAISSAPRPCPVRNCGKSCDEYGVHAMSCMRSHDMIGKHNLIVEYLAHLYRLVGYKTSNNVPNLTLGPHSKERPADYLVLRHSVDADKATIDAAFDVTVANPIKASAINKTASGQHLFAATKLYEKKLLKVQFPRRRR